MYLLFIFAYLVLQAYVAAQDIVGCGGFVQSDVPIAFEKVKVKLYTKQGAFKFKTECAPNNGYFLVAVYDKGEYTLRIDPPEGWGFEPKEIDLNIDGKTDRCSKGEDINFKFSGFSLRGKIGSVGKENGPAGVTVDLLDKDSKVVGTNVTDESGGYQYQNIMPGDYVIKATHPTWVLKQDSVKVTVTNDNVETEQGILIAGYDVKGHVLSSGEPIEGVSFILFANPGLEKGSVTGCNDVPDAVLSKIKETLTEKAICYVLSDKDGSFLFPTVPSGNYVLVPYYTTQNIVFDIVPSKLSFAVNHRSVVFKTSFQVYGFSVKGKVIDSKGNGISGVQIHATNDQGEERTATSLEDGSYLLENITTGHYNFKLMKEHYLFPEENIHITPNTPNVKDIVSKMYSVCGKIIVAQLPSGVLKIHQHKVLLTLEAEKIISSNIKSTNPTVDGDFCFITEPGKYKLEVHTTEAEKRLGFLLKPSVISVEVLDKPVLGLIFEQYLATVKGKITCLEECKDVSVYMIPVESTSTDKIYGKVDGSGTTLSFVFENVLPGKYKVFPLNKKWCWSPSNKEIQIIEDDIENIELKHSGYHLKCTISHNITLNFTMEERNEIVGSFELKQGTNQFCLKSPGTFSLTPKSCYQFEQNTYTYKTSDPKSLTLTVASYKVVVHIESSKKVTDLQVKIRGTTSEEKVAPVFIESEDKNVFHYELLYWGRLSENYQITPISKEILFLPNSASVTVQESCPGASVTFDGKEGIFIEGETSPPLANVIVTIKTEANEHQEEKKIDVSTDQNGKYRVGPMHSNTIYNVEASKEGYFITPVADKKGSFIAQKLGHITVKVADENDQPMSAVLLSLSGGQYRNNILTQTDGSYTFSNLGPGQYFLRPMQKEYSFDPSSKMLEVAEGEDIVIRIKGKRVAFSVSGFVSSLSGIPEEKVAVEAVGLHKCSEYQETTVSDNNGNYKLRGLVPGCAYNIRMMKSEENAHIERLAPANQVHQIQHEDITDVNFIVFMKPTKFHLTVQLQTEYEYLSTLKVLLFSEENPDYPIHTISPGVIKYVQFPPLTPMTYIVKVQSSLSPVTHETQITSATVIPGDDLSRKNVKLKFEAKKRKMDLEPTQSVIALPFAVAFVFLAFNYDAVLVFLIKANAFIQSFNKQDDTESESQEADSKKKKWL